MNSTFFIPHSVPFLHKQAGLCAALSSLSGLTAARKEQTAGKNVEFFEKCCGTQKGVFGEKGLT